MRPRNWCVIFLLAAAPFVRAQAEFPPPAFPSGGGMPPPPPSFPFPGTAVVPMEKPHEEVRPSRQASRVLVAVPNNVFAKIDHDKPSGIMAEAVNHVLKQMGLEPAYVTMPPEEIRKALSAGEIDVACVRIKLGNSTEDSLFTDAVLSEYNVPITRSDSRTSINRLSDLQGKRIAGRAGFRYPGIERAGLEIVPFDSDGAMMRALFFGKVDVVMIGALSDTFVFRNEGVLDRVVMHKVAVGEVPLHAAFSAKRFTAEDVNKFNVLLKMYKESGEWMQSLDQNGYGDLVTQWPLIAP